MLTPELIAQEKRHEKISAISTTIIMVILLLLTLLWTAYRNRVPPPGEKDEYEILGAIDFGDYKNGSKRVNNFQKAVADPEPAPQQQQAKPVQEAEVSDQTPDPTPPVVTKAPSPVNQPDPPKEKDPDPKPSPPKNQKPKEDTKADDKSNDNSSNNSQSEEPELTFNNTSNSGSNQGDSDDGIGNSGTPDVKVLDPKGLYSFGTGSQGGLKGRSAISMGYPEYTVQEDGDVTFEFIIEPNGSVSYAKVVGVNNKPGLARAGINAIRKWRFSKLRPGQGSQRQTVRVTMSFKLK